MHQVWLTNSGCSTSSGHAAPTQTPDYVAVPEEAAPRTTWLRSVTYYFNRPQGRIDVLRTVSEYNRAAAADLIPPVLHDAEDRFFHEHIKPLRAYLLQEWHLYFYCIPVASYATSPLTGRRMRPIGPLVLSLIPQFPDVARERGASEAKIAQLAYPLFWLVRSHLCSHKLNEEQRHELIEVITAWSPYIPPYTMLLELDMIERNNPFLITQEVRRAILPEAVLALQRAPAARELVGDGGQERVAE